MSAAYPDHPDARASRPPSLSQPLPPWLDHFKPASAQRFVDLVADLISARWPPGVAALDLECGRIMVVNGATIGIANIARQLPTIDELDWRAFVYEYLSSMDDVCREGPLDLSNWAAISPSLGIRLYAKPRDVDLFGDQISADLVLGVAARIPIGTAAITMSHVASWGVTDDEVWDVARRNSALGGALGSTIRDDLQITLCLKEDAFNDDERLANGPEIVMLSGGLFTTGLAADLSVFDEVVVLDPIGEHGALISAPSSELMLVLPIRDLDHLADHVIELSELTAKFFESEPHPLSPTISWYRSPGMLCPAFEVGPNGRTLRSVAIEPLKSWLRHVK